MPAVIMIGGKGGPEKDEPTFAKKETEEKDTETEAETPALSGLTAKRASKDILGALEAGDAVALDKALRAHYEACGLTGGE